MRNLLALIGMFVVTSAGLGIAACSSTTTVAPTTGTDGGTDGSVVKVDSGSKLDGSTGADSGPAAGSSCALAIDLAFATQTDGVLDAVGKSIYYKLAVKKGDFLSISTDTAATNTDQPGDVVDTALMLYDAAGKTLLATNDDAFPRFTTDSDLWYRPTADATLCLQVTDFDTWKGTTPQLAGDNAYKVTALSLAAGNFDTAAITQDTEPNETIATAKAVSLKPYTTPPGGFNILMGDLKDQADVDTYKVTLPAGTEIMTVAIPPIGAPVKSGSNTYGSTLPRFTATIKNAAGTILGELVPPGAPDTEKMSDSLSMPITPGDIYITISRPAGFAAAANDFYVTTVSVSKYRADIKAETETLGGATNNTIATAEVLTMTPDPGNAKLKRTGFRAFLPTGDAMDNFSFPVTSGDKLSLFCSSARDGSGIAQFKVDLIQGGTSLQSETETALADIGWYTSTNPDAKASKPEVKIAATGTATLQLSGGTRSATNTGVYYFCSVSLLAP